MKHLQESCDQPIAYNENAKTPTIRRSRECLLLWQLWMDVLET